MKDSAVARKEKSIFVFSAHKKGEPRVRRKGRSELSNSFTKYDYLKAREALSIWQAGECQDVEDYVLRERKAELCRLVRKVIKNELDDRDRLLVSLCWYKGKSKQEVAELIGVDRSTVFRRFEKINDIIYEKLKYALEYRYGDDFSKKAMLLVKKDVSSNARLYELESIGERLLRLREEQFLSRDEVSALTGISVSRLKTIEKSGKEITMCELKKLSSFFRVTSDYIIFGKERVLRDSETGRPVKAESLKGA